MLFWLWGSNVWRFSKTILWSLPLWCYYSLTVSFGRPSARWRNELWWTSYDDRWIRFHEWGLFTITGKSVTVTWLNVSSVRERRSAKAQVLLHLHVNISPYDSFLINTVPSSGWEVSLLNLSIYLILCLLKSGMSSLSNREIQEKTQPWGGRADTEAMAGDQDPDLVQGKGGGSLWLITVVLWILSGLRLYLYFCIHISF